MNRQLSILINGFLTLVVFPTCAQVNAIICEKIVATDRQPDDWFGFASAITNDYSIVGTVMKKKVKNGNNYKQAGAVYFLKKDKADHWTEVQKIDAPGESPYQWFGCSVGISGDYAIVGANGDHDIMDTTSQVRMGTAYLFKKDGKNKWVETEKYILEIRNVQDDFGKVVSIQGQYVAISATGIHLNKAYPEAKGAVFIYNLLSIGKGEPVDTLISPDWKCAHFGESIGLSGNQLVVSGGKAIYIYQKGASGKWKNTEVLQPDTSSDSEQSFHVSIWKDYLLVGDAGDYGPFEGKDIPLTDSVYKVANINASGDFKWTYVLNDKHIRDSLGISAFRFKRGALVVESEEIRKKRMAGAGTAYIYHRNKNGKWNMAQQIYASDRKYDQHFGNAVSISDSIAVIGAFGDRLEGQDIKDNFYAGAAYMFKLDKTGVWKQERKLTSNQRAIWTKFGFSVAAFGNNAMVGSRFESGDVLEKQFTPNAGAVYIYTLKR